MGSALLLIENDQLLYLTGLRDAVDFSFKTGATVAANVVTDEEGLTVVPGGGPVSLTAITLSSDTVGGTTADPTVVKSMSGFDLVVTVGATTALALSAGRFLRVMHDDQVWQLRRDAAGAADSDVTLHLEPFLWSGSAAPRKVKVTVGELLEIEDGSYSGILDAAFTVTDGTTYFVKYDADAGGGLTGSWVEEVVAQYRAG